ncbi:MAG TPA: phosphoribosylglycinamide formyltransferase [Candidatus Margulisiibacteriota bacterium]|nr:phosphoribosylglycinamide formyltransferase [Candidatus Margulisiibacteriota bacterium]
MEPPVRLAVLLSGSGTTLQNLLDRIADGRLAARVAVVLASRTDAGGLERARRAGIPAVAVPRKEFSDVDRFNDALHAELEHHAFDLIVLAGFLSPFQLRNRYAGRVMNIHPALIPAFCGKGLYGEKVHRAVLEAGVKVSGCTVHFADEQYDHGPIVLQGTVPVLDDDTPKTLAARVHGVENELYPQAIRLWAQGRLEVVGRRVRIRPEA